jgi:two-component system sensor kinase FixL
MNPLARALRSAWGEGLTNPLSPQFWLIGIGFLVSYLALNVLTARYQFEGLGITLWSPDNGLSVLLLMEGSIFVPFALAGEVLSDVAVSHVHLSLYVIVLAEFFLTLGYAGMALALRHVLMFRLKRSHLPDLLITLAFVSAGALVCAFTYCGVLYLAGSLPADGFVAAASHFWIGDAVGIIAILSTATALFELWSKRRWSWRRKESLDLSLFLLGSYVVFALLLHGASGANPHQLLYLLFLPVISMAMRAGYTGVAIALLATQTAFFMTASHIGFSDADFDPLQILMLVLSTTGLVLGAVVTERERANQRLREQQEELVRVSARATAGAMGMLLAHELSQPLSTVATYALAARRMLQSGAGSEPVIDALRKTEAETQRTRQVLERIRDLVSAGKTEPRPVDLFDTARRVRTLCIEGANARGVHIAVESVRPVPLVTADVVGIEHVLNNLVTNAVDAAAERGDARGRVIIRVTGSDNQAIVEVDDNGSGVAPELAESLFEPYKTSKSRGMGLGLALSRQIVQQHGGRLSWRPIAPEGTRFVVELNINGPDGDAS